MAFTREEWARGFLAALGNTSPTQATVDWVVGWTVHETGTGGGATFNLLNTTQAEPGSSYFNHLGGTLGVQNYTSFVQGVQTNAAVLGQGFAGYGALKTALLNNDVNTLSNSPSVRQGLTTWCGGCGYGVGFQALGAAHRQDSFGYGSASGNIGTVPSASAPPPSNGSGGGTINAPGTGFFGGAQSSCTAPSGPLDVGGAISYAICTSQSVFVSFGEHIAVFILALVLIGGGIYLLAHKQINAAVATTAKAGARAVKDTGEAAAL